MISLSFLTVEIVRQCWHCDASACRCSLRRRGNIHPGRDTPHEGEADRWPCGRSLTGTTEQYYGDNSGDCDDAANDDDDENDDDDGANDGDDDDHVANDADDDGHDDVEYDYKK